MSDYNYNPSEDDEILESLMDCSSGDGRSFMTKALSAAAIGLGSAFAGYLFGKRKEVQAYKRGYDDASRIYSEKYEMLTEAFLKAEKSWREEKDEYEALLDAYDKEIENLEGLLDRTREENQALVTLLTKKRQLEALRNCA